MGVQVDGTFYDDYYFAPHFQQAGYTVGVFGKHLNGDNPNCPPPGVDVWLANGGGNYWSPQFAWATSGGTSQSVQFNNCSDLGGPCYSTTVIADTALNWLQRLNDTKTTHQEAPRKPFFAYVAFKAPHIQDGPGWPVPLPEKQYV